MRRVNTHVAQLQVAFLLGRDGVLGFLARHQPHIATSLHGLARAHATKIFFGKGELRDGNHAIVLVFDARPWRNQDFFAIELGRRRV